MCGLELQEGEQVFELEFEGTIKVRAKSKKQAITRFYDNIGTSSQRLVMADVDYSINHIRPVPKEKD